MKPVIFLTKYRLQNVKEKEYLFLIKLVIFQNGKVLQEIHTFKIMCAKDIY